MMQYQFITKKTSCTSQYRIFDAPAKKSTSTDLVFIGLYSHLIKPVMKYANLSMYNTKDSGDGKLLLQRKRGCMM